MTLFAVAAAVASIAGASTVFLFEPDLTHVPNLQGKEVAEAVQILRRSRLHLEDQTVVASDAPAGTVIDQLPGSGDEVRPGSGVSVVVSESR